MPLTPSASHVKRKRFLTPFVFLRPGDFGLGLRPLEKPAAIVCCWGLLLCDNPPLYLASWERQRWGFGTKDADHIRILWVTQHFDADDFQLRFRTQPVQPYPLPSGEHPPLYAQRLSRCVL